jgi:hypothetical protein
LVTFASLCQHFGDNILGEIGDKLVGFERVGDTEVVHGAFRFRETGSIPALSKEQIPALSIIIPQSHVRRMLSDPLYQIKQLFFGYTPLFCFSNTDPLSDLQGEQLKPEFTLRSIFGTVPLFWFLNR